MREGEGELGRGMNETVHENFAPQELANYFTGAPKIHPRPWLIVAGCRDLMKMQKTRLRDTNIQDRQHDAVALRRRRRKRDSRTSLPTDWRLPAVSFPPTQNDFPGDHISRNRAPVGDSSHHSLVISRPIALRARARALAQ